MDNDHFDYFTWFNSEATEEEKALSIKAGTFEPYFKDMVFDEGSASHNLIMAKSYTNENPELEDEELDYMIPEELQYFNPQCIKYKIEERDDCNGYYSHQDKTLCVVPSCMNSDSTLLHELIHAYEHVLNEQPMYFHDSLYWVLYQKLKKCIPDLDEIITEHAYVLTGSTLYIEGGVHDILFLLKSFDLDIQCGYSLGTVFGYGRTDDFAGYTYDKEKY